MSAIPVRPAPGPRPVPGADIAPAAALMRDPARAAMLTALLDDRALAAGELAELAGVSLATASEHLTRLLGGGLVTVMSQAATGTIAWPGRRSPPRSRPCPTSARPPRCAACAGRGRRLRSRRPAPAMTIWPARRGWRCSMLTPAGQEGLAVTFGCAWLLSPAPAPR
jgi:Helix-turn-helix domain